MIDEINILINFKKIFRLIYFITDEYIAKFIGLSIRYINNTKSKFNNENIIKYREVKRNPVLIKQLINKYCKIIFYKYIKIEL